MEPDIVAEKEPDIFTEKEDDIIAEKEPDIVTEKEDDIVTEKEDDIVTEKEPDIVTENVFVNFIIPSVDRPTFLKTLESLINQTNLSWKTNVIQNAFVTFIIPSIGRPTLSKTLESLINQTNPNWKAIVIFDGISANIDNIDSRITFLECEKLGRDTNSAGLVRNYGIQFADTEWIAFVDDDDCISNDYVELFKNEILEYDTDILIFRMNFGGEILPSLDTETFFHCRVGISFGLKRKIFEEGVIFEPGVTEDFSYLDNARNKNYKIMISPHVTYFVRNYENIIENQKGNRVFINFTPP
jgi:hypothetical protein